MQRGQELIEEIVKRRGGLQGSVRHAGASYELRMLRRELERVGVASQPVMQLAPVRVVACVEGCLKSAAAELIDYGKPYLSRSRKLLGQTRLDFDVLTALLGERITVGEVIVHSLRWQDLDAINATMSTLLEADFFHALRGARDRSNIDESGNARIIVTDLDAVLRALSETIRVRQVLCHEIASLFRLSIEDAIGMLECGEQFVNATSWLVSETLYPDPPLSQSEMTEAAWREAHAKNDELEALVGEFLGRLDAEDQHLLRESQAAWLTYREKFATLEGNAAKGGTLAPQLTGNAHGRISQARIEEINHSLLFTGWQGALEARR